MIFSALNESRDLSGNNFRGADLSWHWRKGDTMKKLSLLVAGLVVALIVPASAETVVIKKKHGGYHGARAQMHGHRGYQGMRSSHAHGRTVVIKRGHHYR